MQDYNNPFEYEAANKISDEMVIEYFIEDYMHYRFIRSRRNVYLLGERGTGKTMAFRFHSFPVQYLKAQKEKKPPDFSFISVNVPCKTPLLLRRDYEVLGKDISGVVGEHFLVTTILDSLIETLRPIEECFDEATTRKLISNIAYIWDLPIPGNLSLLDNLWLLVKRENIQVERFVNGTLSEGDNNNFFAFNSHVISLITLLKKVPVLSDSHFSFMFDDAQDLGSDQIETINSWISYRDTSQFSFKVASTKVDRPSFATRSGSSILEGHDFTLIDMEQPYQNRNSDYGKLAKNIVQRRLEKMGLDNTDPFSFFPISPEFEKALQEHRKVVEKEADEKFPDGTEKQRSDHVYKYFRARYFADRSSSKANLPPYSGFDILVHISTGVIRNLLNPCFFMYDSLVSERKIHNAEITSLIDHIPPRIQKDVLLKRSKEKWEMIEKDLPNLQEARCSTEQSKHVYRMFDNLAKYFVQRLKTYKSEPRAISFTLSEKGHPKEQEVRDLLKIARRAQVLYEYTSSAKDSGGRETYFVPNRILYVVRGLDPHGQHARASIKISSLWEAAINNTPIPLNQEEEDVRNEPDMFQENL